jgi:O-antigen chain-terminating methyltransferase
LPNESPDVLALRKRLEQEESAYAALLGALDSLAAFAVPVEGLPGLPAQMEQLNALWRTPPPPQGRGPGAKVAQGIWTSLAPALESQQSFNSLLVQVLNGYLEQTAMLHARLRQIVSALVQYLQRVQPLMDVRDRVAVAQATQRSELILEAFDRRQESLARRVEGLLALRDRLEAASEEVRALKGALTTAAGAATTQPATAAAALHAADDSTYVAFENRFRGSTDEIRERLASYLPLFEGCAPVADLGCGRGEFLELLAAQGIAARGVESNAHVAQACRARGLDVLHGDLVAFLRGTADGALGGVFAAQVAEHLPPAVLQLMLREAHRCLRPGGVLVLETVNPRSVIALLEGYNRDLTHEKPLHPDTLSFLAAAHGFSDVRVELKSPVEASSLLRPVPVDGLPALAADVLNENVRRLNELLYGHQDYALIARR